VENVEIALIRRALMESNGVVAHAAKVLQLNRTTLTEKIRRYGID
jgi:sigma-54 specific flagellar transcriptional regulator A